MRRKLLILSSVLFIAGLAFLVSQALAVSWITTCGFSHSNMDDPIVFPGQPGASHQHTFVGANSTNAFSTFNSLSSSSTTCLMAGDHSGYWVPTPNYPISSKLGTLWYYNVDSNTVPFPDGLRMIVGNAHATSESTNPAIMAGNIQFKCGPGSSPKFNSPPKSCPVVSSTGKEMPTVWVHFPSWWDGKNLDTPDHLSHMSYKMDATHKIHVPELKGYIRLDSPAGQQINLQLSSGPYYTEHVDFFDGWVKSDLQHLINQCAGKDCGVNPK